MLTIQETSRQTGLSEPTLPYYEEVGLIGPVARDESSGNAAAGDQRDILLRHAPRVEVEIATLGVHLEYLRRQASLWDARDRGDAAGETAAGSGGPGAGSVTAPCPASPRYGSDNPRRG